MAYNGLQLATSMSDLWFVKLETTAGQLIAPVGTDAIRVTSTPQVRQPRPQAENLERIFSLSRFDDIPLRPEAGTFEFSAYFKPSGSLGVVPNLHVPMHLLTGATPTVTPGTRVRYDLLGPASDLPTASIWHYMGHTVEVMSGCVFDRGEFVIDASNGQDAILGASFSGLGMQRRHASTMLCTGSAVTTSDDTISLTAGHGRRTHYPAGLLFEIVDSNTGVDNNGGAGYTCLDLDESADTIQFTSNFAAAHDPTTDEVYVRPFYPTPVDSGQHVIGAFGQTTYDGVQRYIKTLNLVIENGVRIPNDVQDSALFPPGLQIRATKRTVSGSMQVHLTPQDIALWRDHWDGLTAVFETQIHNAASSAGEKIKFHGDRLQFSEPDWNGDEEKFEDLAFALKGNSGEDECYIDLAA